VAASALMPCFPSQSLVSAYYTTTGASLRAENSSILYEEMQLTELFLKDSV